MGIKVIIVDMNTMMSSETCKKVSGICLQEVSLLADHSVQPAFMLACLSAHTEILYPLQILNEGSISVLRRSIDTLVQYHRDTPLVDDSSEQTITQCVQFILNTADKLLSNTYNQVAGVIDVLFITCQTRLKGKLDSVLSKQTITTPKKVTVLTIAEEEKEGSEVPECLTEIDDISVSPFYTNIQRPLRKWFFGQESELATLSLPDNLILSCDLLPLSIDPSSLSAKTQSCLTLTRPKIPGSMLDRQQGRKLKGEKLFKLEQICESVLFGSPMLLIPSTHWTMEWDTLEENQHNFAAFCKSLSESNSALLCRNSEEVEGLFLILAETDGTALIKPIVCSELLLPKPNIPLIVQLSDETTQLTIL
ncbi:uncharacterized protein LOC134817762 isoform X2 [Bolinopsis microptera]|uniref:uncharacterized protein LOC134817762 isoform X2 n=1 Tax=Bolinopsis microptera TaxID=2820187 RepID=UPI003079DAFB